MIAKEITLPKVMLVVDKRKKQVLQNYLVF